MNGNPNIVSTFFWLTSRMIDVIKSFRIAYQTGFSPKTWIYIKEIKTLLDWMEFFSILLNMCIDSCMTKYDWILLSTSMLLP